MKTMQAFKKLTRREYEGVCEADAMIYECKTGRIR